MKRTIVVCLAVVMFFVTSVCFGAKVDPTKIAVPRASGRIVETYVAPNPDAPVIAYVQDIHLNYEAQKAEADILEALIRDYGFDLVFKEAKQSDKDFKYLRNVADKETRTLRANHLLEQGIINGVNFLDLATDNNFKIQGIEDMSIYGKEIEDLIAIDGKKESLIGLTNVLRNIASNLKLHIYTKEQRDLDDKIAAYDKDEIGLVEYVKFLQGQATANNIDVKTLPNAALFIESANLEGKIDFPAVETERKSISDAIEKALTEQAKKDEFAAKGLSFRTGNISQGEFYAYLKTIAETAKIDLTPHKNLSLYTQYITTYEKIDTTLLFKEIDQLVDRIKMALIKTPEQKKLSQIDKGLSILSDMVNIKLVPDEYNFYLQNKMDFDPTGWVAFLKENSTKFGLTNSVPDNAELLKENIPLLEKFYAASFDRDTAMVKNIETNLVKYGKDKAILVTGGFHSANIKKLLMEKGYSFILVAPRVDVIKNYDTLYRSGMRDGWADWKATNIKPPSVNSGNADKPDAAEGADSAKKVEDGMKQPAPEEQKKPDEGKGFQGGPIGGVVNIPTFVKWVNEGNTEGVIGELRNFNEAGDQIAQKAWAASSLADRLAALDKEGRASISRMVEKDPGLVQFVGLANNLRMADEAVQQLPGAEPLTQAEMQDFVAVSEQAEKGRQVISTTNGLVYMASEPLTRGTIDELKNIAKDTAGEGLKDATNVVSFTEGNLEKLLQANKGKTIVIIPTEKDIKVLQEIGKNKPELLEGVIIEYPCDETRNLANAKITAPDGTQLSMAHHLFGAGIAMVGLRDLKEKGVDIESHSATQQVAQLFSVLSPGQSVTSKNVADIIPTKGEDIVKRVNSLTIIVILRDIPLRPEQIRVAIVLYYA